MALNKFGLSVVGASLGFALLAGCANNAAAPVSVEAACGHVDAATAGALCTPEADAALVACQDILPAFRDQYPMCAAPAERTVTEAEAEGETAGPDLVAENDDISIGVISSGSSASLVRDGDRVIARACAGGTCSSYDSHPSAPQ